MYEYNKEPTETGGQVKRLTIEREYEEGSLVREVIEYEYETSESTNKSGSTSNEFVINVDSGESAGSVQSLVSKYLAEKFPNL